MEKRVREILFYDLRFNIPLKSISFSFGHIQTILLHFIFFYDRKLCIRQVEKFHSQLRTLTAKMCKYCDNCSREALSLILK